MRRTTTSSLASNSWWWLHGLLLLLGFHFGFDFIQHGVVFRRIFNVSTSVARVVRMMVHHVLAVFVHFGMAMAWSRGHVGFGGDLASGAARRKGRGTRIQTIHGGHCDDNNNTIIIII